jgi:hypothetical protein
MTEERRASPGRLTKGDLLRAIARFSDDTAILIRLRPSTNDPALLLKEFTSDACLSAATRISEIGDEGPGFPAIIIIEHDMTFMHDYEDDFS